MGRVIGYISLALVVCGLGLAAYALIADLPPPSEPRVTPISHDAGG